MKKRLAVLTATAVLGITSAFAAHPFSDVTPQDWAYKAVAQLAAQGVIEGYPDGTFMGQHKITRYEMAQMVAKALAHQDSVDVAQNEVINRLANEFSAELGSLGVRVSNLENKVGNIKFTGDARVRVDHFASSYGSLEYKTFSDFQDEDKEYKAAVAKAKADKKDETKVGKPARDIYYDASTKVRKAEESLKNAEKALNDATEADKKDKMTAVEVAKKDLEKAVMELDNADVDMYKAAKLIDRSKFTYRTRLHLEGEINENTKAGIRMIIANKEFGSNEKTNVELDNAYLQHQFGKYATGTIGRYDNVIGSGLTFDDTLEGGKLAVGTNNLNASVTYGYAKSLGINAVFGSATKILGEGEVARTMHVPARNKTLDLKKEINPELVVFQVDGKLGRKANIGAFYTKVNRKKVDAGVKLTTDLLGKHAYIVASERPEIGDSLDFYGVYGDIALGKKVKVDAEFAKFKDFKHSNAWVAGIAYGNYDMKKAGTWNAKVQYYNFDTFAPVLSTGLTTPFTQNYKAWMVSAKYAIVKNVGLAVYGTVNAKDQQGHKVPNLVRTDLNYKF